MKMYVSAATLRGGASVLALSLACLSAGQAWSAEAEAASASASGTVEEIVVTARKREENLKDVPLAITAVTQTTLREAGVDSLAGLATLTPGLAVASIGGTYQAPVIRGLAQIDQTATIGNVGVFIDGVFINNRSGQEFGFLDVARIEVLKGPQSAAYGQNTFSGAIDYVTKLPVLGEYDGYVTAQIGNYDLRSIQGSVNIPLGENWAVRLSGGKSEFDGTIKNLRDGGHLGGWRDHSNYAASLLFKPSDDIRVRAFYTRTMTDEEQAPYIFMGVAANNCGSRIQGVNGVRFSLFCGKLPYPESVDLLSQKPASGLVGHNDVAYLTGDWDLHWATATATVGKTKAKFDQNNDFAGFRAAISTPSAPGSTLSQQTFLKGVGTGSFEDSYDLRLTSPGDQPITWIGGLYYFHSVVDDQLVSYTAALNNVNLLTQGFFSGGHRIFFGRAIYGSVGWEINDKLKLSAEARQAYDTYKISLPSNAAVKGEQKFTAFTPRFTVSYKVTPDINVYASAAKGQKIGGFNTNAFGLAQFTFKPETQWTYEVGTKGWALDHKLSFDAAVYYIDWTGIQVQSNIVNSPTAVVINNLGATSYGIESDTAYYFTPDVWLRFGFTLLHPTYKDGTRDGEILSPCGEVPGQVGVILKGCSPDVSGKQLSRTSDRQFSLTGNWTVPNAVAGFDAYARADYSYQAGRHYLALANNDEGAIKLMNGRVGLKRDNLEFAVFGKNLLDSKYLARSTQTNAAPPEPTGVLNVRLYPGARRTFGVEATARF